MVTILALLIAPNVRPTLWFPYPLGHVHSPAASQLAGTAELLRPSGGLLAGGSTDPKSKGRFGSFHNSGKSGCRLVAQLPNGYYACLTIAPGSSYTHKTLDPATNYGFTDEFVLTSGSIQVREEDQLPSSCPNLPVGYPNPIPGVTPRLRLRRSNGRTTLAGTGTDYTLASPSNGTTSWTASVALGGAELFYNDMDTGGFAYLNSDDGRMCVGPDQGSNPPALMMCAQNGG